MRSARLLIALSMACFLSGCLWLAGAACAAPDAPITLTVSPDTLALAPGESARVLVVASVAITTGQSITLSTVPHRGLGSTIDEPRALRAAQGEVAWMVTVTRQTPDLSPEPLLLRVDYDAQAARAARTHGIVTAALKVESRTPDPIEKTLKIDLLTGWDTIEDTRQRQAIVVATNTAQIPLTVTRISVIPGSNVTATVSGPGPRGQVLQPREAQPFTITLTAANQVEPGPRLLVATVDAAWAQSGQQAIGSAVLSHPYQVNVYGESAILSATKIPSLLLLPGFLFVTAILILRKVAHQQSATGEKELSFTDPAFWFLGITLSLLATLLYPVLTALLALLHLALLGQRITTRNLVQAYGFVDILILWFGAALLGALS